jgi:hypothetical protein
MTMRWNVHVGVAIVALVLLGLFGVRLSGPRPLDAGIGPQMAPWTTHLEELEPALSAGDWARAAEAWDNAWITAQASGRWQPLIDVGDAALRVGDATATTSVARVKARRAYRAALIRARAQRSVDGVVRSAESFAALGDRDVTEGALHMARKLAAHDATALTRVETDAARITARVVIPGRP